MSAGLWRSLGERAAVWPGRNWPLGATWTPESTNFAVHAPQATDVWLCVFDEEGGEQRHLLTEQSLGIWHGALPGIAPGTRYGCRVAGPWDPARGLRFNPQKLLLDPYGLAVSGDVAAGPEVLGYDVADPTQPSPLDSAGSTARSVVVDPAFDWEGDTPDAASVARHRHLRAARQGLHRAPRPDPRGAPRHVRRPRAPRRDRLPHRPRRDRRRAAPPSTSSSPSPRCSSAAPPTTGATTPSATSHRTARTPPRATAASRSPSSSRW
ncbi:hypothetical protein [Nocardioides sp. TF02-7]|uniref:hypothetical protein n=1 Tax=Nocardioides sp. TF02-7 TaxID=2917724 RepID=UPI001F054A6E|nr:hypothetical protein [Nocardioides sp. TF02-7]UMG92986.1 hypothetical protein MF408_01075 [Nocardioides sp. TF02-7]